MLGWLHVIENTNGTHQRAPFHPGFVPLIRAPMILVREPYDILVAFAVPVNPAKTRRPPTLIAQRGLVSHLPVPGTPPAAESQTPVLGDNRQDLVFAEEDILLVVNFDLRT